MRGSDIEYNPVFFSWVVVKSNGEVHLFVDNSKVTLAVRQHLNLEADVEMRDIGTADANNNIIAILHPYEDIDRFLGNEVYGQTFFILTSYTILQLISQIPIQPKKIWISDKSAYSLSSKVAEASLCSDLTPVTVMKAVKNAVEIAGRYKFLFFSTSL